MFIHTLVTASCDSPQPALVSNWLGFMVERGMQWGNVSMPLSLASGQRIVTLGLEPVLDSVDLRPMTLAASLLEPSVTTHVVYSCNLPPLTGQKGRGALPHPPLDRSGMLPSKIGRDLEAVFLTASFPGGQTDVVTKDGARSTIKFRWVCVTSEPSIGAVWRCFVQARDNNEGEWNALPGDYLFDAASGSLLNSPSGPKIPLLNGGQPELSLNHPTGMPTSLPCRSGRVKVTHLSADGWMKRDLLALTLDPSKRVVARFSDGKQTTIGTAAKAQPHRARAA
jgi:hypothetical protein